MRPAASYTVVTALPLGSISMAAGTIVARRQAFAAVSGMLTVVPSNM
jgi:hypothetical protein